VHDLFALLQFGPDGWGDEIAAGAWLTVRLALATLPLGLAIGFLAALARNSRHRWLIALGNIFATIFRGLPELLTLFVVYYGAQASVSALARLLFGTTFEISPFLSGMVALGLVLSSYASEVFLSAFEGIPVGQYEGAYALGFRWAQLTRLVILPQLIRLALPGLSNLWLNVMKDTALVSVITLNDLLRQTQVAVSSTKEPFFFYAVACLIYLLMSVISSAGIWRVNAWASRGASVRR
jgi:polar amino acid transport system permease protein